MRTLTITTLSDWDVVLRKAGKQVEAAIDTRQYQGEWLNFETPDTFLSKLPAFRWDILNKLRVSGKTSTHELARKLGLDANQLQNDIRALLELGLIEQDDQGALLCPYEHIQVDIPDAKNHL